MRSLETLVQCSGHPDIKYIHLFPAAFFPVPPGREVGYGMDVQTGVISQERLNTEVKLLLNPYRTSYMPRRLAQQRMTLSDLEWPFHFFVSPSRDLCVTATGSPGSLTSMTQALCTFACINDQVL